MLLQNQNLIDSFFCEKYISTAVWDWQHLTFTVLLSLTVVSWLYHFWKLQPIIGISKITSFSSENCLIAIVGLPSFDLMSLFVYFILKTIFFSFFFATRSTLSTSRTRRRLEPRSTTGSNRKLQRKSSSFFRSKIIYLLRLE